MDKLLKRYAGGIAWGMTGYGPKPTLAPPDEKGTGNESVGDDDGDGSDDTGDDSGADDDGDKGAKPVGRKFGGLLGKRTATDSNKDDAGDDDEDTGKPDADGRPKGLADKFWNAKDKTVNVDALMKSHSDAEKALGELKRNKTQNGGDVPKTAEEYFSGGIEVPEEAINFKGLASDDPGVKSWADVCKEEGLGKDIAARLMTKMLVKMNDHAPTPVDPDQEMKALGKGGQQLVDGLYVWVEGMEQAGSLNENDIDVVEGLSQTANGIRFLAKMRNMSGEMPIPITPGSGAASMSQDEWREEYKAAVKKGDYKRQAELDKLGEGINGTEPGISGRQGGINI